MTEMDSDVPKKTTRPRRRKAAPPVEDVSTVESVPAAPVEKDVPRPVIEDVLEETAAARAEIESAPPSERDMDFESLDQDSGPGGPEGEGGGGGGGGGGDYYNDGSRRRRRRRGRGRGPNGPGDSGYQSQPMQNRQPRGRNGQQMDRRGGQQQGGHRGGPRGPRPPQSNEPRGPEVLTPVHGILELHPKGYGFLRDPKAGYRKVWLARRGDDHR
jgi:transcription termination factor Rho